MNTGAGFVIAIDGPVASGKGTIAPRLAKILNGFYLYSGSIFRCIALYCLENEINFNDEAEVTKPLDSIQLTVTDTNYLLNGKDVTNRILEEDVAKAASAVAVFKPVREKMVKYTRQIAFEKLQAGKAVVIEGRDTANSVFPEAEYKIYLTAKPEVRAKRRFEQIKSRGNLGVSLEEVYKTTIERDTQDFNREISPLPRHPETMDYFIVDSSDYSEDETVNTILGYINTNHG